MIKFGNVLFVQVKLAGNIRLWRLSEQISYKNNSSIKIFKNYGEAYFLFVRILLEIKFRQLLGWHPIKPQIRPAFDKFDQIQKCECTKSIIHVVLLMGHKYGEFVHQNCCEEIAAINVVQKMLESIGICVKELCVRKESTRLSGQNTDI